VADLSVVVPDLHRPKIVLLLHSENKRNEKR
jgi:hypothetical protein